MKKLLVLSLLLLATAYAHKLPPTSHGSYTGDAVVGQLLNFSGASSQDNDQQTLNYTPKYEWDFSYNGTFSPDTTVTSSSVNHRYGTAGSYTVAIRFTDNDNQQGNIYTFTITIEPLVKRYYYVKDHLGNIRQTLDEGGNIVSAQDYYPFGGIYRAVNTADANDKYKFTEKERDKETDYDYFGARYYDSDLSRWLSADPLADKYAGWSPYNYGLNNPLRNIDPDGKDPTGITESAIVVVGTVALLTAVTIHSISYATNSAYRSRYNSFGSSTAHLISNSAKEINNFVVNLFSSDESETSGGAQTQQQLESAKKSHEDRIKEHENKLKEYQENPEAQDNKGRLKNASAENKEKIMKGRIKVLKNTIEKHQKELKKVVEKLNRLND